MVAATISRVRMRDLARQETQAPLPRSGRRLRSGRLTPPERTSLIGINHLAAPSATLGRVTQSLAQRLVLLAAIALLGAALALAAVELDADSSPGLTSAAAPSGWNTAFAGSRGPTGDAQRTSCGQVLAAESLGITHPVLPCGAKLVLRHEDRLVLSEVIDNALVEGGRQLEVTEELAETLGLEGTTEIEWRFATEASG
jgi:hypothetical protein